MKRLSDSNCSHAMRTQWLSFGLHLIMKVIRKAWHCSINRARLTIDRAAIPEWTLKKARFITSPLLFQFQITRQRSNDYKILAWMWKRLNTFGSIIDRFI